VDGKIIIQEADDLGFSRGALYDAKKRLGIRNGVQGKKATWELPS